MKRALLLLLAACDAASPDPGLGALLQIPDAQFRPGGFPDDTGGPAAVQISTRHGFITIGRVGEPVRGVLEPAARGAVIGIEGSSGTWLIAAGVPDIDTPGLATAKATFGLAESFPPGPFELLVAASDDRGRFGPPARTTVVANPEDPPMGELVITLAWESSADLDLHVVAPTINGVPGEAYWDHPNTWGPIPGEPVDPLAYRTGGILDHDGNKDCVRETHPDENVIWEMPPQSGDYIVRVDARSMCSDASAAWYVQAAKGGVLLGAARGVMTDEDVKASIDHGRGAGVLALRFTLP